MSCDWGWCDQLADAWRWDPEGRRWLPVCVSHYVIEVIGAPWITAGATPLQEPIPGCGRRPRELPVSPGQMAPHGSYPASPPPRGGDGI